jgi:hypothetical protein
MNRSASSIDRMVRFERICGSPPLFRERPIENFVPVVAPYWAQRGKLRKGGLFCVHPCTSVVPDLLTECRVTYSGCLAINLDAHR